MKPLKETTTLTNVERVYSRLHEILVRKSSGCYYLNLGYWKDTDSIKKACEQLIDLVVSNAGITNGHSILDVGFGYGDQDIYIARQFPQVAIHGINIIQEQVAYAQETVQKEALSGQIKLEAGDAVNLQFDPESFDAVIAIESAFHFNTREMFFKEAFRVLKNKGVLCLADCLPPEPFDNTPAMQVSARNMAIPESNLYNIDEYVHILGRSGFTNITFTDISEWVLPHSAVEMKDGGWRNDSELYLPADKAVLDELVTAFINATTIGKYYIIRAEKNNKGPGTDNG